MKKPNNLLKTINQFVQCHNLIPDGSTIVVGLSGGPDSIFLLHYLVSLRDEKKLRIITAHLDHQWREDSQKDVEFCRDVARELDVEFVAGRAKELSSSLKFDGSQEELGRKMRRQFLQAVVREHGADRIALAHHLQDQEETFFIRLIRGTTLTGLTAMRAHHGMYIRPLLEINKDDICAYLDEHTIAYLVDPTNIETTFLRNRIRHAVLPALRECDARFNQNFLRTLNHLKAADDELELVTTQHVEKISRIDGALNFKQLFNFSPYMQKRILLHWLIGHGVPFVPQEAFLDELLRFLHQQKSTSHRLHETWRLVKDGEWVVIQSIS